MQDIFIALIFVAMVIYPALTATLPDRHADEDESAAGLPPTLTPATESARTGKTR